MDRDKLLSTKELILNTSIPASTYKGLFETISLFEYDANGRVSATQRSFAVNPENY